MEILNNGMDWQDPSNPNYRYILYFDRKLINRGTKCFKSICSATYIREVTKDFNIEIRVNIEEYPILNNEMNILNNGMDWQDPSVPNYRYILYFDRTLLIEEQNAYSQYVLQRILEE